MSVTVLQRHVLDRDTATENVWMKREDYLRFVQLLRITGAQSAFRPGETATIYERPQQSRVGGD